MFNRKYNSVICYYELYKLSFSPPPADRVSQSASFNVGTAGAKIFSGLVSEEFGYTVLQAANHEGQWYEFKSLLVNVVQNERIFFLSQCYRAHFMALQASS